MKRLISISVVVIMLTLSLVGCSSLSKEEKIVFDAVKKLSKDFLSPGDVRITDIEKKHYYICQYDGGYYRAIGLEIQGENASGGKSINTYYIVFNPITENDFEDIAYFIWDEYGHISYSLRSLKSRFKSFDSYLDFLQSRNWDDGHTNYKKFLGFTSNLKGKITSDSIGRWSDTKVQENFDIAKINKELKKYWDKQLGND